MARPTRLALVARPSNLFATRRRGNNEFSSQRARLYVGSYGIRNTTGFRLRTEAFSIAPLPSCLPPLNPYGIAFADG
jgi:hypothetical protein